MDIRRFGTEALLVTPDRDVSPASLAATLRSAARADVVEVVPGAETVLVAVSAADVLADVADWVAGHRGDRRLESADGSDREVVLDVVYDGDDLAEVAAAAGLSVDDVVELHSAAVYRCDFCGFAPGFAYLSGLDQRLHLPRRSTPRTSVPAGSVAIAGRYSAAYPSASPGGWHLLGRTDVLLWDLAIDHPALITPGTTVRVRRVEGLAGRPNAADPNRRPPRSQRQPGAVQIGGRRVLRVVSAGVASSLQDRGRAGSGHLAVPRSGAVDRRSADLVNRLVGNRSAAAVLETAGGLVLEAIAPVVVADSATGAVQALTSSGRVAVNPAPGEAWAYLAVRGGLIAEPVLESRSWDSLSKLGPPPLQPGDELAAGDDPATPVATDQAPHPPSGPADMIRVSLGPRADRFGQHATEQLTRTAWTVASTSRVGARLTGAPLACTDSAELPSEGLVEGAIQVPPDGQPVVMLADHPTTGGYPVIGVVAGPDVGRLAQRPPGSKVRFHPIDRKGS